MSSQSLTELQLLQGILGSCSGTMNNLIVTKTGVVYLKPIKKKKERVIREKHR